MTELYSNDSLKIIRTTENKHIYRIEFAYPNPILIHSLIKTKLLRGATCTDDYKMLTFKAYSVQMFDDDPAGKKSIYSVSNMVATLAAQLKYLYDTYYATFIGFNTNNLIVIDDNRFLFLDGDLIREIDEDTDTIMISEPFDKNDFFFSPEMENITFLPAYVHYKTCYFSLGCLLFYALMTEEMATTFYQEYLSGERINDIMNKYLNINTTSFKETKLYWLISRCLVEEPEKRSIVFV